MTVFSKVKTFYDGSMVQLLSIFSCVLFLLLLLGEIAESKRSLVQCQASHHTRSRKAFFPKLKLGLLENVVTKTGLLTFSSVFFFSRHSNVMQLTLVVLVCSSSILDTRPRELILNRYLDFFLQSWYKVMLWNWKIGRQIFDYLHCNIDFKVLQ